MANLEMRGYRHEEENEPFNLDTSLLQEYPEMLSLSGLPKSEAPKDTWNVSQIYVNGRTIDSYIEYVKSGQPSGNIEYHLKLVEDGLKELAAQNKPEYQNFIQKETEKLKRRKAEAAQAIGDKQIGSDGIYR